MGSLSRKSSESGVRNFPTSFAALAWAVASIGCESVVVDNRVEQLERELEMERAALFALEADFASRISALEAGLAVATSERFAIQSEFNDRTSVLEAAAEKDGGADLLLRLDFDADALRDVKDLSTLGNEVVLSAGGVVDSPDGKFGKAASFSGGVVTIPQGNRIPDSLGIWVELWVQPSSLPERSQMLLSREGGYALSMAGDQVRFVVETSSGSCERLHPNALKEDQWNHVEGYYDGKQVAVEVDGLVESARCSGGPLSANVGGAISIGADGNGEQAFGGRLDALRIWRRPPGRRVRRCPDNWSDINSACMSPPQAPLKYDEAVAACMKIGSRMCDDQQLVYACTKDVVLPRGRIWSGTTIWGEWGDSRLPMYATRTFPERPPDPSEPRRCRDNEQVPDHSTVGWEHGFNASEFLCCAPVVSEVRGF